MGAPPSRVELEYYVADPKYPFVAGSAQEECTVALNAIQPQSDGSYLEFFHATTDAPNRITDSIDNSSVDPQVIGEYDGESLFMLRVTDPSQCVAASLADEGAFLRELWADNGHGRLIADVMPPADPSVVCKTLEERHPSVDLVSKRTRDHEAPQLLRQQFCNDIQEALTDRQLEVLLTAFGSGYFERPRRRSATELSGELGISQATFSQHLRIAQEKVLTSVFNDRLLDQYCDQAFTSSPAPTY